VLRRGATPSTPAVAAAAVLSVTEPHMTGIGGDMFAIVWLAREQKLVALNASGRAGSLMTRETLQARGFRAGSQQGVMSVTVPGALAGWDLLVRTHGRRTLAQLLQPAIAYARDGFPVSPIIAAQWANETAFLERDSAAAATYLPAAGRRRPASGSGTPTTRARCRSSPTAASGPSTAAPSAGASSRGSPRSTASSRSTTSAGTRRTG
jgi:gamma-glutamyltranspeptidase/glutathione hydrolase